MKTATFVEEVANQISRLGLTTPAILLIEAHKPLAFISSQLLLVAQPTLDIFLPPNLVRQTADMFADPEQLEELLVRLETASVSRLDPPITPEGEKAC
jgi:hypothetical protein